MTDAANTPRTAAGRDDLCAVCGHHLHLPDPIPCQWYDCQCGHAAASAPTPAEQSRLDHEKINRMRGGLHLNSMPAPTPAARCNWCGKPLDGEGRCRTPGCEASTTPAEPLDVTLMRKTMVSLDRILDGPRPRQWPLADQIVAQYNRLAAARPEAER